MRTFDVKRTGLDWPEARKMQRLYCCGKCFGHLSIVPIEGWHNYKVACEECGDGAALRRSDDCAIEERESHLFELNCKHMAGTSDPMTNEQIKKSVKRLYGD